MKRQRTRERRAERRRAPARTTQRRAESQTPAAVDHESRPPDIRLREIHLLDGSLLDIGVNPLLDGGLDATADGVQIIDLPHRDLLEARLGRGLGHLEALTGPAVAEALGDLGATAAARDDRIYLADAEVDLATVAHEVVHALQVSVPAPLELETSERAVVEADSEAEQEAARLARDLAVGGAIYAPGAQALAPRISAPLPAGAVALLRADDKANQPGGKTAEELFADAKKETSSTPAEKKDTDAAGQGDAGQEPATGETTAEGEPAAEEITLEEPKPTFEPPAIPDTQLSPEEKAKRDAELQAAEQAIEQADSAGGVVGAFADAPPSLKARAQKSIGPRVEGVTKEDQAKFENEIPTFEIEMGGEIAEDEVPKVEAPGAQPGPLEAAAPKPAEKPDLPPTEAGHSEVNAKVKAAVDKILSFFGLGPDSIGKSFKEVKTSDDEVETSPGEKPKVPVAKGTETDPERVEEQKREGEKQGEEARDQAFKGVIEGPGPEQAKLRELKEERQVGELAKPQVEPVEGAEGAEQLNRLELPEEVSAQFDQDLHATMQQNMQEARQKTEDAEKERDSQRQAAVEQAETDRKTQVETADSEQREKVLEARKTIQTERQTTLDAQDQATRDLKTEAETKREASRGEIDTRIKDDEEAISGKYDTAETDAKKEEKAGETKAEKKRKEEEKKAEDQSWWDRAKNFVKEAFAKLTAAIGAIFDAVRAAIKTVLDAARKFAKDLIDKAAAFIKDAIKVFGEALKGLVNTLLADTFPGLAKALNEKIDGAVEVATKAVDAAAESLKKGVDAIVDGLQKGLDAILDVFQGALNFALSVMQAALTGDWGAVFKQVLEAALKLLGIDPQEFYKFVDKVKDTLGLIVEKPGQFLSNLLGAVKLGFSLFADNFLTHLQAGVIKWLTGSLGGDIQIPAKWDIWGVLDLVRQILGLTWDWLKERAAKLIGEKNVERLEHLFSYVETLRTEGWAGLFKRIKDELSGLKDTLLGEIKEFLVVQVVKAGVLWLAGLFNPVGALVKVVMTVWNIYTFLRDQLARIIEVVKTIVGALDKIVHGVIEEAGKKVESVLGNLLPVAIDLIAKLLGISGVTAKVRAIIKKVRKKIADAADKVLKKVAAKFSGKGKGKGRKKDTKGKKDEKKKPRSKDSTTIGDRLPIQLKDGTHHLHIVDKGKTAQIRVESSPQEVEDLLDHWRKNMKTIEAGRVPHVTGWINEIDGALKPSQEQADLVAVARGRSIEAPREVRDKSQQRKEAELTAIEGKLKRSEKLIVDRLMKLFPEFETDDREVVVRFQRASAIADFSQWQEGGDWVRLWIQHLGGGKSNAGFDRTWGVDNGKLETKKSAQRAKALQYRLKGAKAMDLVPLVARFAASEGRKSPQLSKARGFSEKDLVDFAELHPRLPSDRAELQAVMPRVFKLLLRQGAAVQGAKNKLRFPKVPPKREFPPGWVEPGKIRELFYAKDSKWNSAKTKVQQGDFLRFEDPVFNYEAALRKNDKAEQREAIAAWKKLVDEKVTIPKPLDELTRPERKYFKRNPRGSGKVDGNKFHVDHVVPVAKHWSFQSGNNTGAKTRQIFYADTTNLRLTWFKSNLSKSSEGYKYFDWVGPKFSSQYMKAGDIGLVDAKGNRFKGM